MNRISRTAAVLLAGVVMAGPALMQASVGPSKPQDLQQTVRHELRMLPYYGVFDNLQYKVDGNTVTLYGSVVRPILKADAYNVVRRLPGVEKVVNDIRVLPLSGFDDRIRLAEARAIFGNSVLSRYAWGPVPPIHIIVENGNVTLEGAVANESEKNLATITANGVFGVFSVHNNLQVEKT